MVDDRARLPVGVVIAAVILGVMAFVGLFVAASAFALFTSHNPVVPRIPTVRLTFAALAALLLGCVVAAVFTIVGLFRSRAWARYAMTLLGLLDFVIFGLMAVGVLILRVRSGMAAMPIPNHAGLTLGGILLFLAVFCAVLALVGLWWMIYFNMRSVRLALSQTGTFDTLKSRN